MEEQVYPEFRKGEKVIYQNKFSNMGASYHDVEKKGFLIIGNTYRVTSNDFRKQIIVEDIFPPFRQTQYYHWADQFTHVNTKEKRDSLDNLLESL